MKYIKLVVNVLLLSFVAFGVSATTVKVIKHTPMQSLAEKMTQQLGGTKFALNKDMPPADTVPNDSPANKPLRVSAPNMVPVAKKTAPLTHAQTAPVSSGSRLWNLQDADILSVINEVSQDTGKNFIVDPRVNGKITLVSSKPLKRGQVYPVFLSVLGALGYSAVPSGNVIKIVPNMESGEQATKVGSKFAPGKGDEVVVRVIPLRNVSAAQLIPVIRPMLPQWSNVSSYAPGNVLILLGRADNLNRIIEVVQDVDRASSSSIQMITLKHASAQQVANVLNNLQSASRASGESQQVSIAVDERSNSILLGGPRNARLKIRVLISQLDAPASKTTGNTEVIYLRYLQAKKLAPILSKIAENLMGKNVGHGGAPAQPAKSSNKKTAAVAPNGVNTFIQAETDTNAIVITAQPGLMTVLKSVISKLDIRPAQVLVQAVIAEISENSLTALGIQWGSVSSSGNVSVSGSALTSFPSLGAGIVGLIPGTDIQAVLSVLSNKNGVDILSTPTIMVLDNQKATIEVGKDVPFQTGSYSSTGASNATGQVTPFTTIDQKPVTLKLDVTPQINLGKAVRLKFNLKNDTLQNPQDPGLTPIINTSKISNSVIVNSSDILVLGGLMSNSNNENINKVPILGDLPILGKLIFTQKTTSHEKKNLMVFLKPVIVHDDKLAMTISQQKYSMVRSTQANYVDDMKMIDKVRQKTLLPPFGNEQKLPSPFEKA